MILSRVPNMNSAEPGHSSLPKRGVTPRLTGGRRLMVALLLLFVLLVSPIALAKAPSEPVLHLTYLPLVVRLYSPDHRIVFASTRELGRQIWITNDDGTNSQRLTNLSGWNDGPAWSPDRNKIAFSSDHADGSDDVYVMGSDGTGVISLTNNPNFGDREPSWSPDGQRIVFTRWPSETNEPVLFVMKADGQDQVQLTFGYDSQPDWSPDGNKIAFTRNNDIYVISLTDTNEVNLSGAWGIDSIEGRPDWSPDGKKIAFVSNKGDAFIGHIWTVNVDGSGGYTQLTFDATDADHPSFSPDGSRIVFSRVANTITGSINLWIVNTDSKVVSRLTDTTHTDANPDW